MIRRLANWFIPLLMCITWVTESRTSVGICFTSVVFQRNCFSLFYGLALSCTNQNQVTLNKHVGIQCAIYWWSVFYWISANPLLCSLLFSLSLFLFTWKILCLIFCHSLLCCPYLEYLVISVCWRGLLNFVPSVGQVCQYIIQSSLISQISPLIVWIF